MSEITPRWQFDLVGVSASMRGPRTATPAKWASRLIGVDGLDNGGVRPFSGFDFIRSSSNVNVNVCPQPFTLRTSDDDYIGGLILPTGASIDFVGVGGPNFGSAFNKPFTVASFGKFVYAGSRGSGVLGHADGFGLIDPVGPGVAPTLTNGGYCAVRARSDGPALDLTTIWPNPGGNRLYQWAFNMHATDTPDNDFLLDPYTTFSATRSDGVDYPLPIRGPNDLGLSADWADPLFESWDGEYKALSWLDTGGTRGCDSLRTSEAEPVEANPYTVWRPEKWDATSDPPAPIPATTKGGGGGLVMFRLFDTRTGRRSSYSPKIECGKARSGVAEILRTDVNVTEWGEYSSGRAFAKKCVWYLDPDKGSIVWPMLSLTWDGARYDTLMVYRSHPSSWRGYVGDGFSRTDEDTRAIVPMFLDNVYEDVGAGTEVFFYTPDGQLIFQPVADPQVEYFEEVPKAGALAFYEGVMLYANIADRDPETQSQAVVRWSDPVEQSVELVRPTSRYTLSNAAEEIIRFERIGANMIGITNSGLYLVRRESVLMKLWPITKSYGVINKEAACVVGSTLYFMAPDGLKVLDATFQLSSVSEVNHIINNLWVKEKDRISMAYDSVAGCICILNNSANHAILLWRETNRITELFDMTATWVKEAQVHLDPTDTNSPVVERAVWIRSVITGTEASPTSFSYFEVIDLLGKRRAAGEIGLWDTPPMIVTLDQPVAKPASRPTSGYTIFETVETIDSQSKSGCPAYILDGETRGKTYAIHMVGPVAGMTSFSILSEWAYDLIPDGGLPAGTRIALNPTFVEWQGHQLGIFDERFESQMNRDFNQTRSVEGIYPAFEDVTGGQIDADPTLARYDAVIYRGNEVEPTAVEVPLHPGRAIEIQSIIDGPANVSANFGESHSRAGAALFPAIRTFIPNVDYRLLGVRVEGRIRGSSRESVARS